MPLDCCHEPNMLTCDEFMQHQALLGSGYHFLVELEAVVGSGLNLVVLSTVIGVEVDLIGPYNVNLATVDTTRTTSLLQAATVALEAHITARSGESLNDWLATRSLRVSQDFADLSATLGTIIAAGNVG